MIYITPVDLERIFELYEERGLEQHEYKIPFEKVMIRLNNKVLKNENLVFLDVHSWLIGWALDAALEGLKKSVDHARSKNYLINSQGG